MTHSPSNVHPFDRPSERLMHDVTMQYEKMRAQLLLIRVVLGLSPIHDPVKCVQVLFEDGREAFEKLRGPKAESAADWTPERT